MECIGAYVEGTKEGKRQAFKTAQRIVAARCSATLLATPDYRDGYREACEDILNRLKRSAKKAAR